jgi:hypothetical protein
MIRCGVIARTNVPTPCEVLLVGGRTTLKDLNRILYVRKVLIASISPFGHSEAL